MVAVDAVLRLLGAHLGPAGDDVEVDAVVPGTTGRSPLTFVHAGTRSFLVGDDHAVQYGPGPESVTYRLGTAGRT